MGYSTWSVVCVFFYDYSHTRDCEAAYAAQRVVWRDARQECILYQLMLPASKKLVG